MASLSPEERQRRAIAAQSSSATTGLRPIGKVQPVQDRAQIIPPTKKRPRQDRAPRTQPAPMPAPMPVNQKEAELARRGGMTALEFAQSGALDSVDPKAIAAATASSSTGSPAASPTRMTGAEFEKRKRNAIADVAQVSAAQLGPAEQAELIRANAVTREVKAEETSQGQLDKMLSSDSAVMKRAEAQGLQRGASRGLLNSSMSVEAAQAAMIDRAQPFAINDAATYANTAESNMKARNQAELSNAQMGTEVNIFNTGQRNTFKTTQAGLNQQANVANASARNSALNSFLDRENTVFLQENQQIFTAAENTADRSLKKNLQAESLAAVSFENALDRAQRTELQRDQQDFSSTQNSLDRSSRADLQDDSQAFQTAENALTRTQQAALQDDSQLFTSGENALNRTQQTNLQDSQNLFTSGENALNRTQQTSLQDDSQLFTSGENLRKTISKLFRLLCKAVKIHLLPVKMLSIAHSRHRCRTISKILLQVKIFSIAHSKLQRML